MKIKNFVLNFQSVPHIYGAEMRHIVIDDEPILCLCEASEEDLFFVQTFLREPVTPGSLGVDFGNDIKIESLWVSAPNGPYENRWDQERFDRFLQQCREVAQTQEDAREFDARRRIDALKPKPLGEATDKVCDEYWEGVRAAYERGLEDAAKNIKRQLCDEEFDLDTDELLDDFSKEKEEWIEDFLVEL